MVLRMFQYETRLCRVHIFIAGGFISLVDSHRNKNLQRLSVAQSKTLETSA